MDALWRIITGTWIALVASLVSGTTLAVAHIYGWHPEKILAARIVEINKRVANQVGRLIVCFQTPPIVPDAPGLVWKRRKDGWVAIWSARQDIVKRGYFPKRRILAIVAKNCSSVEKEWISDRCMDLQYDMLQFKGSAPRKRKRQKEDPAMEEILQSIRRIIAADSASA